MKSEKKKLNVPFHIARDYFHDEDGMPSPLRFHSSRLPAFGKW